MSDELADLSNSVMTLRIIEMVRACAEARGTDHPDQAMSLITAYDAALNALCGGSPACRRGHVGRRFTQLISKGYLPFARP
ncbi:MAG: hypothetical protein U5N27_08595 [Rhizobium sp.]|nr:hypothetical protein [Rhizobium sp.]